MNDNGNLATWSPDLTPLDFYLWNHVTSKAYAENITSLTQLNEKIVLVFEKLKTRYIEIYAYKFDSEEHDYVCSITGNIFISTLIT